MKLWIRAVWDLWVTSRAKLTPGTSCCLEMGNSCHDFSLGTELWLQVLDRYHETLTCKVLEEFPNIRIGSKFSFEWSELPLEIYLGGLSAAFLRILTICKGVQFVQQCANETWICTIWKKILICTTICKREFGIRLRFHFTLFQTLWTFPRRRCWGGWCWRWHWWGWGRGRPGRQKCIWKCIWKSFLHLLVIFFDKILTYLGKVVD